MFCFRYFKSCYEVYEEETEKQQIASKKITHVDWTYRCYYFCGLTERQEKVLELHTREKTSIYLKHFPLYFVHFQVSTDPHISRRYGLLVLFSTCHALVALIFLQLRIIRVESEWLWTAKQTKTIHYFFDYVVALLTFLNLKTTASWKVILNWIHWVIIIFGSE